MSILILSQSDSFWEVARSAGFADITAHLESGTTPAPIKLNANPIMIARFTGFQSNSFEYAVLPR